MTVFQPQAVLQNRYWWRRQRPFNHFAGTNVFTSSFYSKIEGAFRKVLAKGLCETRSADCFTRRVRGYDAYIYPFPPMIEGPLSFFISRGWHDLLASLTQVPVTSDVSAALHHHEPGSDDGVIHNDLNPGWFVSQARKDGINPANSQICNYNHGVPHAPSSTPVERIRAVAMIYFLNNPEWKIGDGGECGLYASRYKTQESVVRVAPINNSILVFECTPHSFHRFLSNRAGPRDSVILWLHCERQHVIERWGERAIVGWSR
jgi:2OG-Fe(II) oxygenase superfamily